MKISEQVRVLEDKIDYIAQNTQFTINITLCVLALAIAIAGAALFFLSKAWVNKKVEKEIEVIKSNLERELKDYIRNNQQFRWAIGTISMMNLKDNHSIQIGNLMISKRSAEELPYKLELSSTSNISKELKYTHKLTENMLDIKLLNYNISDGDVKWSITWLNDELYK